MRNAASITEPLPRAGNYFSYYVDMDPLTLFLVIGQFTALVIWAIMPPFTMTTWPRNQTCSGAQAPVNQGRKRPGPTDVTPTTVAPTTGSPSRMTQ